MKVELLRYPAYHASRVSWAKTIPLDWETGWLGECSTTIQTGPFGSQLHATEYVTDGIPVINPSNIIQGRVAPDWEITVDEAKATSLRRHQFKLGDIVFARRGEMGRCAPIGEAEVSWLCGTGSMLVRLKAHRLIPKFAVLLLSQAGVRDTLSLESVGATMDNLNTRILAKIRIPIPPLADQQAILTFLDRETAKIDRLMAVRRKQVERLQEQRSAVIHHAVTKGLDPQAEMKPSGVTWLGNVPKGWCIHRLRRTTFKEVNGFWGDEPTGDGTDITCIRVADFDRYKRRVKDGEKTNRSVPAAKCFSRLLNVGDLLLEKSGGGEQTPVGCVVLYDKVGAAISSNFIARLTPLEDFDSSFLCYLHQALYDVGITKLSVKQTTGIQNIDSFWYLNERAPFPPKAEQVQIAAHIDRDTTKLDTLITKYQRELELLAEYRASLISHAVTGKIDVRGLVDPAP